MTRLRLLLAAGGIAAALTLIAAPRRRRSLQAQPGLWEISGVPGAQGPSASASPTSSALARFEHRGREIARAKVLKRQRQRSTEIDYSCGGAGFGHSEIDVLTPRSLRISTQGISDGLPFNYVLQARRVGDCPKNVAATRH